MPADPETSLVEFQFETLPHVCLAFTLVEDLDASDDVRALCSAVPHAHEKAERALQEALRCWEAVTGAEDEITTIPSCE